jgi:serine/threonine-protein kinase SRPK3
MMELLGPMPKHFALGGKQLEKFYAYNSATGKYSFQNINGLRHFPLKKLLMDQYRMKPHEAEQLSSFLMAMLCWLPKDRASA